MALCAAAWEQGVPPVGSSVADQNPDFLEAVLAYRGGVQERKPEPKDEKQEPSLPDDEPFAELDAVQRAQEAQAASPGKRIARATGRRRKPK